MKDAEGYIFYRLIFLLSFLLMCYFFHFFIVMPCNLLVEFNVLKYIQPHIRTGC